MKILIVEDEQILTQVLKEKFEEEKFKVKTAIDGKEALSMTKKFEPDIVLLDIILPKKSGFEVLKELKSDVKLRKIPVIIMSNLGADEKIKKGLALGAEDYLVKTQHPINEIIDKVKENLIKPR